MKWSFDSRSHSVNDALSSIEEFLQTLFLNENQFFNIKTGCHELIQNAVCHGNLEIVSELKNQSLALWQQTRDAKALQPPYSERQVICFIEKVSEVELILTVENEGEGFDFQAKLKNLAIQNPLQMYGRGIFMVQQTCDELHYELDGRRAIAKYLLDP